MIKGMKVCCNVHKKASEVVDAYINSQGSLELALSCGCKVCFKLHRLPQKGEKMLSDVWHEITEKLKQKAISGVDLVMKGYTSLYQPYTKWVRFDDVEKAIQEIEKLLEEVNRSEG